MKNKLKKLGVLAVLLANVAIFAPQKAEGQNVSGKLYDDGGAPRTHKCYLVTFRGSYELNCGGSGIDCANVSQCAPI